jgi:hypothetical protein
MATLLARFERPALIRWADTWQQVQQEWQEDTEVLSPGTVMVVIGKRFA